MVLCPVRYPEEGFNPQEEDRLAKGTAECWPGILESVWFISVVSLCDWVVPNESLQPLHAPVALSDTNPEEMVPISGKNLSSHVGKRLYMRVEFCEDLGCPSARPDPQLLKCCQGRERTCPKILCGKASGL